MTTSAASATALLTAENLTCTYGGRRRGGHAHPVLRDVSLCVDTGDLIGIVGPSGSGKTTLLRALLGTITPVAGGVTRRPGLRVGYVPQVETVDWSFPVTVGECVLMARTRGRLWPWRSSEERLEVTRVLDLLGLSGLADRHIRQLSGGQQQRVFVARALLGHPHVLLMDEPTSGVDVKTRHEILHLLSGLSDEGLTIVLTTHDLNGIAAHLPSLVCLNGRVIAAGSPNEVLVPQVLEATFGAPMDVLEHGGLRVVVDGRRVDATEQDRSDQGATDQGATVVPLRRIAG